ncbi:MAG: sulfatase-like hydrolase/transferase [Planctomycetota bacterium]
MKRFAFLALLGMLFAAPSLAQEKPNILWIVTDDQRYDSIRAFNQMLHGRGDNALGYVESPHVDRLAEMGTTFINTYCHAPGCAPSRSSMHLGRYPFRSGVYEFEYYNNLAEHTRPTLPEQMAELGYQTARAGKRGVRLRTVKDGRVQEHKIYHSAIRHHEMWLDGLTDWGKSWLYQIDGEQLGEPMKNVIYFVTPEGEREYASLAVEERFPKYAGMAEALMEKYDHLRRYNPGQPMPVDRGLVLAGVSSQPAGKTRDGWYVNAMQRFLESENTEFSVGTQTAAGVDPSRPVFYHLGFDFPHTPVLPPADYRERFQQRTYNVPEFDRGEFDTMPAQMRHQAEKIRYTDHLTDVEKQKMIQDYYAFCAYGDELVGQAADTFIAYSEQHDRPWMIVYVCGDHGWRLNEHGSAGKFAPWEIDTHNPVIVVSSDKARFPAGKVVRDFTEFVDIAPTCLAAGGADLTDEKFDHLDGYDLAEVASGQAEARDYIIGETHAVIGPRAFIRTRDYVFSMQIRPDRERGKHMDWALHASYEELDPGLYHTPTDPDELNNLAFDPKYEAVASAMKDKLVNIVLGDNRVEVAWGQKADGTEIFRSNFAPGADDKVLQLPAISDSR